MRIVCKIRVCMLLLRSVNSYMCFDFGTLCDDDAVIG